MLNNISSKKIAYLIGFLAGDGAYCDGFGKRSSRLAVTTVDMDVVNWISDNIEEFSTNHPKFNDNIKAGIFARQASYTKIFAVKHSEFFNRYGILCKKQDRTFNNIAKCDMRQFMMGLIDSDGCISFTRRKDRDRIACRVSITQPSVLLLEKVQTFLMESLDIPSTIRPKGTEKCFVWGFSKITHVEKFCEWLYSDASTIVLQRKLEKWLELREVIESKRELGSCYPKEFVCIPEYSAIVGSISKSMFIVEGIEYPSASIAAKVHKVEKKLLHSRCTQRVMGYSKRPKTEEEVLEYSAYVDRAVKKLYIEWSEVQ